MIAMANFRTHILTRLRFVLVFAAHNDRKLGVSVTIVHCPPRGWRS
jgi:hypothetical protein